MRWTEMQTLYMLKLMDSLVQITKKYISMNTQDYYMFHCEEDKCSNMGVFLEIRCIHHVQLCASLRQTIKFDNHISL